VLAHFGNLLCSQPLHGIDLFQPLDLVWPAFPLGLDDVPEELKPLADELPGSNDPGIGEEPGPLDKALYRFREGHRIQYLAFACPVKCRRAALLKAGFNWAQVHTAPGVDKFLVETQPPFGAFSLYSFKPRFQDKNSSLWLERKR